MDTGTLQYMLRTVQCAPQTKVLACNELPDRKQRIMSHTGYIVNLQESWKPGNHWIVLYVVDKKTIELFDSVVSSAEKQNPYIQRFLQRFRTVHINKGSTLQSHISESCGLYCIYYLYLRCKKHLSMNMIICDYFTDDAAVNECIVLKFVNQMYNPLLFSHIAHECHRRD
jgi:hypothetical protein